MLNKLPVYRKTICLTAGLLGVAALPPYYVFPVLFVSFGLLLYFMDKSATPKQAFACGYWFGFGWFACGFSWVGNALLIDAAAFGWLYPLTLLAAGAFFGLFAGIPAALAWYFKNTYARWLAFASFWVILEWIRSFIFTGFPWNLLGSVLAFDDRGLQLASFFGTYGLSLLVLLCVSAPALIVIRRTRASAAAAAALIAACSALVCIYGQQRLKLFPRESSGITVRIVQPSIPQTMKWDAASLEKNFLEYISLSCPKPLADVDFVIWGETAVPYALDIEPGYRELLTAAVPPRGYLITGLVRYEFTAADRYRPLNSMFIIDKQGEIVDFYDKSHLVPFGEYIPLRRYLPEWVRPIANTVADFKPGKSHKTFKLKDYPSFGALICYEIIFPAQVVNEKNKPQFLVNLTNDAWYGTSAGPYQHLVTARLRAVEEGIAVIRAANTGISAIISPAGQTLASLPLNYRGIIDAPLPAKLSITTFYGQYGNLVPLTFCFVNILLAFFLRYKLN